MSFVLLLFSLFSTLGVYASSYYSSCDSELASDFTDVVTYGTVTLEIYAITLPGEGIFEASKVAAAEINNNTNILPNYDISVIPLDAEFTGVVALRQALEVINDVKECLITDNMTVVAPFLLGCPWSSLSIMTSQALNTFEFAQMSSSATSTILTDRPYFYRTVPVDSLQAQGIIQLCVRFNWTEISILHDNDAYGTYLAVETLANALDNDITARAISYQREDGSSIQNAIHSISTLDAYIIVCIIHGNDMNFVFSEMEANNIWDYPYFYIGVDAWMSQYDIQEQGVEQYTAGYVGTAPWQAGDFDVDEYSGDWLTVYQQSLEFGRNFSEAWAAEYAKDPSFVNDMDIPSAYSAYGRDSLYALSKALHVFDVEYTLGNVFTGAFNQTEDNNTFIEEIAEIMSKLNFIGATGNVSFDSDGDRQNGLYSYSYILPNGSVQQFGYFYETSDGISSKIDASLIVWPESFRTNGLNEPRSSPVITTKVDKIDSGLFVAVLIFVILSTIFMIVCVVGTIYHRKIKEIKAGGWTLNLIMCSGCFLAYICIILLGVDEGFPNVNYRSLCNFRIWLGVISFTLIYMPLFMKTYRLSKIFTSWINSKAMPDYKLYLYIAVSVGVDILLLLIFTVIDPHERVYSNGDLKVVDSLQYTQYQYGSCSKSNDSLNLVFYVVVFLWKILQLCYGIYCALILARIGIMALMKFDETGQQVFAIAVTVVIASICAPSVFLIDDKHVTAHYAIIAFASIVACNVTLVTNIWPRLLAVFIGKPEDVGKSTQEVMFQFMKTKLKDFQRDHSKTKSKSKGDGDEDDDVEDAEPAHDDSDILMDSEMVPTLR